MRRIYSSAGPGPIEPGGLDTVIVSGGHPGCA
jgi:hypothetical protein